MSHKGNFKLTTPSRYHNTFKSISNGPIRIDLITQLHTVIIIDTIF